MNILLTIKLAIRGLLVNKMRAFLTILGIIIGVSGIIVIVSVGNGAESLIVNQVKSLGSNLIGVLPGGTDEDEPPVALMGIVVTTLKNADVEATKDIPHIQAISGYNKTVEQIVYKNRKTEATINGVYSAYPEIEDAVIYKGRFFSQAENFGLAKVVVLGSAIKDELFGESNPIGENIKVHNQNFRIIGVFDKRGVTGFANNDSQIFIPARTMQKLVLGINHVSMIKIKVTDTAYIDQTVDAVKNLLRTRHRISSPSEDDFTVASMSQRLNSLSEITGSIKFFLTAIAFIALIVGGVGIMNVMYISVTERTHEIGLRKALGAQKEDILKQFLVEAVAITSLGGIIGIIIGVIVSFVVALIIQKLGYSWDFIITLDSIAYASLAIMGIGVIFGYAPAKRAANHRAIEALRYE